MEVRSQLLSWFSTWLHLDIRYPTACKSPPASTEEFRRLASSWDPCASIQALCHTAEEGSLVELASYTHAPPDGEPPHWSYLRAERTLKKNGRTNNPAVLLILIPSTCARDSTSLPLSTVLATEDVVLSFIVNELQFIDHRMIEKFVSESKICRNRFFFFFY